MATRPDSPEEPSRRDCWAWVCVHACSHAGLAVLVVAYALLGAVLFELVEGGSVRSTPGAPHHLGDRRDVQRSREECLRELWTITERLNVLYEKNWTRLVHEQLRKFEMNVMAATQLNTGSLADLQDPTMAHQQHWSFGGALLYSVTVITTIGYGNLTPRTSLGKVLTMVYALFGVPLMLLCLSSLGQLLARGVHFMYLKLTCQKTTHQEQTVHRDKYKYQRAPTSPGRSCNTLESTMVQLTPIHKLPVPPQPATPRKSALATVHTRARCRLLQHAPVPPPPPPLPPDPEEPDETDDTESGNFPHDTPSRIPLIHPSHPPALSPSPHPTPVPVLLVVSLLLLYLCLGAYWFARWENWSYLDAAYFCFLTLSTIGFGDFSPPEGYGHLQLILCCAYLVTGLVLVAMSFSLVQEQVVRKCRSFAERLGLH